MMLLRNVATLVFLRQKAPFLRGQMTLLRKGCFEELMTLMTSNVMTLMI